MRRPLPLVIVAVAVGASLLGAAAAFSATTISVTEREFKVLPKKTSAKAGRVTFAVRNRGTVEHEFEVVKWSQDPGKIPVRNNKASFDEDLVVGEAEDIEPGKTKRLTVRLKAGRYVLLCNQPGHYKQGQYRAFRVTR